LLLVLSVNLMHRNTNFIENEGQPPDRM
jgi:hypothetical protein